MAKNIAVGKRPRRFALTPDGAQLWVTNELDASVTVIDTRALTVLDTIKFTVKGAPRGRHHAGGHHHGA